MPSKVLPEGKLPAIDAISQNGLKYLYKIMKFKVNLVKYVLGLGCYELLLGGNSLRLKFRSWSALSFGKIKQNNWTERPKDQENFCIF